MSQRNRGKKETNSHVYFWGSYFSNFYIIDFEDKDGIKYFSSEQYFMAKKALHFSDMNTYNEILKERDPARCKSLGRQVANFNDKAWSEVRFQHMVDACILKFSQNEFLKKELLRTGNKIIVEGSPLDAIWGVKLHYEDEKILDEKNWKGLNLLGLALMETRDYLNG